MRCLYCHSESSRVTDSRGTGNAVRRRRECADCGERFTTLETVLRSTVQVVKKDGRREDFDREKLLSGLRSACAKRTVSADQLDAVVADIEGRVSRDGRLEISSSVVGELAVDALRSIDHIAYIRFASVYRAFADLDSLKDALQALDEGRVPSFDERIHQLALLEEESRQEGSSEEPAPFAQSVG
ncbi:MAG: transcriptional regulator NrdR [Dehalococcoidia bacterium]|nr:transcriptional regulator NrdR [Dehalococcoidia bacterium]HCV00762.1 transcriptional repressor NrdR [Dehalococcoidia bacterium]